MRKLWAVILRETSERLGTWQASWMSWYVDVPAGQDLAAFEGFRPLEPLFEPPWQEDAP